ncbi:MAG: S1/P1 nuclease [candidate division KSB1 bacterium]|nr:S1/P1 nuclease [candidate division KSB1 bacterium]
MSKSSHLSRTVRCILTAAMAALFLLPVESFSWGFAGHRLITKKAVMAVRPHLRAYLLPIADSLSAHSIDPDLWRKFDRAEGNRHYIDLDSLVTFPFDDLPTSYPAAVKKYGEEVIQGIGIAPWRIAEMVDSLSAAMKQKNARLILRYAAALAHYVEDIHNPLHTTKNYDGQLTGNKGIHSRYERWMVETYLDQLDSAIHPDPGSSPGRRLMPMIFNWLRGSYVWVDNLLLADRLSKTPGKRYTRNSSYDDAYYERLFRHTRDFTVAQMSKAATAVASCWQLAWNRAGRPKLNFLHAEIAATR